MTWDHTVAARQLERHGQHHVLRFWNTLDAGEQQTLLQQVQLLDFDWLRRATSGELSPLAVDAITPYREVIRLDDADAREAVSRGEAALRAGRAATLLVAGGQGTRLGFDGPKGAFSIGPLSGRSLFQIHAERQLALSRRYGAAPPLYVMTSPDNHEATLRHFEEHDYFGLAASNVLIFAQGVVPATDERGRLLLADKHRLVLAPNGNGGLFAALRDSGALDHMRDRGADLLSYIQVDNPLSLSCDARFIGYHLLRAAEFSCKAIAKHAPEEKVGHYALVRGRLAIVEYGELPDALARQRDAEGQLLYGFANPGLFVWSRAFLQAQAEGRDLPVHRAHKKIPHIDPEGHLVRPEHPNGYKLELFALDTLPLAEGSIVLECERAAEFAPVKSAQGADSPTSAQQLLLDLHRRWIEAAGARLAQGTRVEISPLFALDADELARKIGSEASFDQDTFLT